MTLALYGKSRKRQGGLLLAAFLAVIAASLGGIAMITSAFAHNAGLSATCTEAKVSFTSFASSGSGNGGKNEPRIDVSVDGGAATTYIASFTGSSFDWSTPIHPTGSVTIKAYWTSAQTRDNHAATVGPQTFTVSCQSKIIVKKVTVNDPGSPNLRFSATIAGPGTAGDKSGNFDTNSSLVDGLFLPDSPNDDFTVTEGSLPNANWAVTGKKILAGDASCDAGSWNTNTPGTASGGELNNMGGKTTTVCFRNTYTDPGSLTVTKVATGGITSTSNPADIKWDITFYNSTADYRRIELTDANVKVVGTPVFTDNNSDILFGDPSCSGISNGTSLATVKTCDLPHHTGVKLTVTPITTPVATCQPQIFGNQVSWRQTPVVFFIETGWTQIATTPASPVQITLNALSPTDPKCAPPPPTGQLIVVKKAIGAVGPSNAAGSVSPAINGDGAWSVPMLGGQKAFPNTPNATYTVTEDLMPKAAPGGVVSLVGYKETTSDTACSLNEAEYIDDGIVTVNNNTQVVCVLNKFEPNGGFGTGTVSKAATGGITNTNDPAAVQWTITLANNNPLFTVPRVVRLNDAVTVVGINTSFVDNNPVLNASCTGVVVGQPLAANTDCFVPSQTTVQITVRPNTIPTRTCDPQTFTNQVTWAVSLYLPTVDLAFGDPTTTPEPAAAIVLNGDPTLCAAPPTISKTLQIDQDPNTPGLQSYNSTHAFFQIVINNNVANSIPQNGIVVTDSIGTAVLAAIGGNGGTCTNSGFAGPWTCNVLANEVLTLHISVPLTVAGTNACVERVVTNSVSAVFASGAPVGVTLNGNTTAVVTVPGTAGADCIMVKKASVTAGAWEITFTNSGPAADINFSDTYQDGGSNTDIVSISGVTGCTPPGQPFPAGTKQVSGCNLNLPNGVTVITVNTGIPANSCNGWTVGNTVAAFMGTGSPQGAPIPGDPSGVTSASATYSGTPGECTEIIKVCKVWRLSQGEVGGLPARDFDFQIQDSDTSQNFILNVAENGPEDCVLIEVARGDVTVSELPEGGAFVTSHELNDDGETAGSSVTFNTNECQPLQSRVNLLVQSIFALVIDVPQGQPICTVYFYNEDPGVSLPTGNLLIQKFLDINGDGDANDPGEHEIFGWGVTTDGPDLNDDHKVTVDEVTFNGILYVGLDHDDVYSVTEDLPATWEITRATVNGANMGNSTTVNATIVDGGTTIVQFFNRQLGGISVHKTTVNVLNGIETVNTNDDDGWTITVKSAACGIDLAKDTDANGNAVFSGLPMCTDYVVAEVLASGEPGYSPVTPASVSGRTPTVGGNTQVNFVNETRSFTPPCPDCRPGTQSVPTPTPTPVTPVPPTATPCPDCSPGGVTAPTVTPTSPTDPGTPPATAVAGERTPGPGQTPIAPSTGGAGGSGGSTDGLNLLLILAGLGGLAGGLVFMAMGRKSRG